MKQAETAYVSGIYLVVVIAGEEVEVGGALRDAGILAVDARDLVEDLVKRTVRHLALNR